MVDRKFPQFVKMCEPFGPGCGQYGADACHAIQKKASKPTGQALGIGAVQSNRPSGNRRHNSASSCRQGSKMVLTPFQEASKQLSAGRKAGREQLLEDVALQRIPAATAWRLAESLRIASGK